MHSRQPRLRQPFEEADERGVHLDRALYVRLPTVE